MKKLTALVLVLLLTLASGALANTTPSRTTGDMVEVVSATFSNPNVDPEKAEGFSIRVVKFPFEETEVIPASYEQLEKVIAAEIEKMAKAAKAENIDAYFGEIVDRNGTIWTLNEMLTKQLNLDPKDAAIDEIVLLVVENYDPSFGDVTVQIVFPTPYEVGQKVIATIGLLEKIDNDTYKANWNAYVGVGVEPEAQDLDVEQSGAIEITLDPEILMKVQKGVALLTVVSA